MAVDYAYPPQLAQFLRPVWEASPDAPPLLDPEHLERVLTVAYQASLLREEDRTVRVRIVVAPPEDFDVHAGPPDGLQPLVFEEPLPYTPEELRRLALAAKYHRALVGVTALPDRGRCQIWGIVQSGPGWIQVAQGARGPAPAPPPSALCVRLLGPGRMAVGRGLTTLAELRDGVVGGPGMDLFGSRWVPERFADSRAELARLHAQEREVGASRGEAWASLAPDLIRTVSQSMVRRFLASMVSAHHGGTVVMLPMAGASDLVGPRSPLRLKYAFRDGPSRWRYRRILLALMAALARAGARAGMATVDGDAYARLQNHEVSSLRDAIFEMSQLIGALTEVDGAVTMTTAFEILGFGAEIVGDLPHVTEVSRSLDLEGDDCVSEPLTADGTRHRSAYRLCSRVPGALVLVVSQDGGVRFVSTHGGAVTVWDHAVELLDV